MVWLGQCSFQRSSVSPSQCVVPTSCTYKCSSGYTLSSTFNTPSLTSTYTGNDCNCFVGTITNTGNNGNTLSGTFTDGSTFSGSINPSNQISITATTQGYTCVGVYQITSGVCHYNAGISNYPTFYTLFTIALSTFCFIFNFS